LQGIGENLNGQQTRTTTPSGRKKRGKKGNLGKPLFNQGRGETRKQKKIRFPSGLRNCNRGKKEGQKKKRATDGHARGERDGQLQNKKNNLTKGKTRQPGGVTERIKTHMTRVDGARKRLG